MKEYRKRIKAIVVFPEGEPIFSELATTIEIDDESGGEFVVVSQYGAIREGNGVAINPEEWPHLRDAIDEMIKQCGEVTE